MMDWRRKRPAGADPWEDRLSDYLDDELSPGERRKLEAHLRVCGGCAVLLEELRGVVARAAACDRESAPSRELWTGIAPRLAPRGNTRAREKTSPGPGFAPWRFPALAAAALVVLAVVASLLWQAGTLRPSVPQVTERAATTRPDQPPAAAKLLEPSREYYDTVAHLRREVEMHLTHDPRVVEVLDENLAAIDAAIAGYRDALAADPGDAALARRLEQARERKVAVLRQAAALASESTN